MELPKNCLFCHQPLKLVKSGMSVGDYYCKGHPPCFTQVSANGKLISIVHRKEYSIHITFLKKEISILLCDLKNNGRNTIHLHTNTEWYLDKMQVKDLKKRIQKLCLL